ncbi:alpha/beta hydrolase [soil metagenome]
MRKRLSKFKSIISFVFLSFSLSSFSQGQTSTDHPEATLSNPALLHSVSKSAPLKRPPLETHSISVDNLKVRYVESGTGQPVILIHGNAGSLEDFEYGAIDLLSKDYRVIAIDRPGHGGSDRTEKEVASVEYQARFLHDTLAGLEIKKPILVGHSWGASVALAYVLAYPDEVSSMVLVAPAAYPDGRKYTLLRWAAKIPVFNQLAVLLGKSLMGRHILRQELARAFYPQPVPDRYFKLVAESWFHRKQLQAFFEDESTLNDSLKSMSKKYPSIRRPVVIVTGDHDNIVSAKDNAFRLKKTIARSQIIEVRETGHEIPQTRPESLLQAVNLASGRKSRP